MIFSNYKKMFISKGMSITKFLNKIALNFKIYQYLKQDRKPFHHLSKHVEIKNCYFAAEL